MYATIHPGTRSAHNSPWHTQCSQFTLTHTVLTIHPGTRCTHNSPWHTLYSQFTLAHTVLTIHPGTHYTHNSPWHMPCSQFTLAHAVLTMYTLQGSVCKDTHSMHPHLSHYMYAPGLCVQGLTQHAPTPQSLHVRSGALCARTHTACTHTSVATCTLRGSVCKDTHSMHPHLSRYMYAPGLCVQGLTQHAPTPQSLYM